MEHKAGVKRTRAYANAVIPAQAGIHSVSPIRRLRIQDASHQMTHWIPAFAGMTEANGVQL
jgi:hypothetical protein